MAKLVDMYIYMYGCMLYYKSTCTYTHMYVCMYVCMYVWYVQNSRQQPPWPHQCYSAEAAPWALLHSHQSYSPSPSPQKLHNRASLSDGYGRIADNSVKCKSKLKWIQIDSNILDLHSAFDSSKRGLHSIRKMTKPSVPSSVGHKEQEIVNDQSSEHIYETDIKQALKETIDGNENKKGDDGTELDEDSLKASGTINKRRFRRNLLEEKDVVKSSRTTRGMVKKNDSNANKSPNDMEDEEKVSLAEVSIEDVTTSDSGKQLKKRKTSVKASRQVELKNVNGSESKQDVNIVVNKEEPWTLLVHKKVQSEWIAYNPTSMRKPDPSFSSLRLLSWNVNGLRALLKGKEPNPIVELAQREKFDVLCLQETKLQEKDVNAIKETLLPGYENSFWSCSTTKLGYSGTAIISRIKPLSVTYGIGCQDHDFEGRIITLEFDNFYLVAGYIPNSGQKLERLAYRTQSWDLSLSNFLNDLETRKSVVLTGDLNCAHQEIDIYNPDGNRKSAGFTDEERTSFEQNFLERGLVDTFRRQHEHVVAYTYWGYRTAARPKNQGWRLDYFLVSHGLLDRVYDSYILPDVGGSDHCPIGLILEA